MFTCILPRNFTLHGSVQRIETICKPVNKIYVNTACTIHATPALKIWAKQVSLS